MSYDAIPDFGLLYDNVRLYASRGDVQFYVDEAARSDGPVLELGCGTGRILLPIARSGRPIHGLDESSSMLARCRAKVQSESADVQRRVTLQPGDVRDFDVGKRFALVILPFRVLQHLTTIDDQLRCLACVRRHLTPAGRFVFDVFNPRFSALVTADGQEREDTPELTLPDGRAMRRAARVARVRYVDQVSEIELVYYVAAQPGAEPQRYVSGFDMRWYLQSELQHLLARAGFHVAQVYGDFDRTPLSDVLPEQIMCAEPR
jgi:SAM-dependent methyltransferase